MIESLAEIGVEKRFGQKTACPDMTTFFSDLNKKITEIEIWAAIWKNQIFGYLNI